MSSLVFISKVFDLVNGKNDTMCLNIPLGNAMFTVPTKCAVHREFVAQWGQ